MRARKPSCTHRTLQEPMRALIVWEAGTGVLLTIITTVIKQELNSALFIGSAPDTGLCPSVEPLGRQAMEGGARTEQHLGSTDKKLVEYPSSSEGATGLWELCRPRSRRPPQASPPGAEGTASPRKPGRRKEMSCWDYPPTRPRRRGRGVRRPQRGAGPRTTGQRHRRSLGPRHGADVVPRAPRVSSASLAGVCVCRVPLRARKPV